jgi:tRNA U34 5-methylaminomethyl-2-thiouridine-forming methyltransferase MnmC
MLESTPEQVTVLLSFAYAGDVRNGLEEANFRMDQEEWAEDVIRELTEEQLFPMYKQAVENDPRMTESISMVRRKRFHEILPFVSCESFSKYLVRDRYPLTS